MNKTNETIHCKPSQLLNLRYLPGVLAAVALLFVPKAFLSEMIPLGFFPEKLAWNILRLPEYLVLLTLIFVGYQILKIWCIRYEITTEELRHTHGILRRRHGYIELYRIKGAHVVGIKINIPVVRYQASIRKACHPSAYP